MREKSDGAPARDPLLDRVAGSTAGEPRAAAIEELLEGHAYERIDRILEMKLRRSALPPDTLDDIRGEVLLKLVNRLQRIDGEDEPIASFPDYVAVAAYNTFDEFVRRAFPDRAKLKNRIRYALQHDERFAVWESRGVLLCGLRAWNGAARTHDLPVPAIDAGADLRDALATLFGETRAPLEVDAVIARFADTLLPVESAPRDQPGTRPRDPSEDLENLQTLRQLWEEICELPLKQRIALLLSARDAGGESVMRFLPLTGVATVQQIGRTLSFDGSRLGALWRELPLEDTRIAVILQVTRQQVINLRRSARERLARRVRGSGGTR